MPIFLTLNIALNATLQDQPSEGLFTEGCFALIEGDYTDDATLQVIAIGHPPCESREAARSIYGHIDFLGKGATTLAEDVRRPYHMLWSHYLCSKPDSIGNASTRRLAGPTLLRAV